ncbi:hypothetical protein ACSYDW_04775 [Paeniglutamicibacter sp. R2-26]|uniref:hypothetical protein n=1 Tax=Paeniglutamicibacter sp. R2-26 TaxID=3144417 RepID=UPI003EE43E66
MSNHQFGGQPDLEVLKRLLTAERLSSYDPGHGEDLVRILHLYESNMRAAAAVMHTMGMIEVLVRNALDMALARWWEQEEPTQDWLRSRHLDGKAMLDVSKAVSRHKPASTNPSHGQIIAELPFGFWRFLVSKRYLTTLWIPAAHRGFPYLEGRMHERRAALEAALKSLNLVRNRAAHNEPIHRRNLMDDLETAIEVAN